MRLNYAKFQLTPKKLNRMRTLLSSATLFLALLNPAFSQQTHVLQVADRDVSISIPDGYVRTTIQLPKLHELTQAALPRETRLVEMFIAQSDKDGLLNGKLKELVEPNFQVHVVRSVESRDFSSADWQEGRGVIAKELGLIEMNEIMKAMQPESNARLSEVAGAPVDIQYGEIGKPLLYGNDPNSLRFTMLIPITIENANGKTQDSIAAVGVITILKQRLVFIFGYLDSKSVGGIAALRESVDAIVTRTRALP